jgi:hypothetical protein
MPGEHSVRLPAVERVWLLVRSKRPLHRELVVAAVLCAIPAGLVARPAALAATPPHARAAVDPICAKGPGNETIGRVVVAGGGFSEETERPLRPGMTGYPTHVCTMSGELAGAGYGSLITSRFTPEVVAELKRFQQDHGLNPDGIYDWATETVLSRCLPSGPAPVSAPRLSCGAPWGNATPVVPSTGGIPGYVFPLRVFIEYNRVDRGQDMESTLHGPFVAIGVGTIVSARTGFPGVELRLARGPDAGRIVYYGHTYRSFVHPGQHVRAGQTLGLVGHMGASYDPSPYHVEVGLLTKEDTIAPGSADEHWAYTGEETNRLLHRIAPSIIRIAPVPPCARPRRPAFC